MNGQEIIVRKQSGQKTRVKYKWGWKTKWWVNKEKDNKEVNYQGHIKKRRYRFKKLETNQNRKEGWK